MKNDFGATTAYGMAKDGGYAGTYEEWYLLFLAVAAGVSG